MAARGLRDWIVCILLHAGLAGQLRGDEQICEHHCTNLDGLRAFRPGSSGATADIHRTNRGRLRRVYRDLARFSVGDFASV